MRKLLIILSLLMIMNSGKAQNAVYDLQYKALRDRLLWQSVRPDTIYRFIFSDPSSPINPKAAPLVVPKPPKKTGDPVLALKTNLLYDALITPNIELEYWPCRHLSFTGEWLFPWYTSADHARAYELTEVGGELRWWPRPYHFFLGAYGAWGYYDLEAKWKGVQGHFISYGLSTGWQWRLSRHWRLEGSVAFGYLKSPYTHYRDIKHDDRLVRQYSKERTYLGPTKIRLSLVWVIGERRRR